MKCYQCLADNCGLIKETGSRQWIVARCFALTIAWIKWELYSIRLQGWNENRRYGLSTWLDRKLRLIHNRIQQYFKSPPPPVITGQLGCARLIVFARSLPRFTPAICARFKMNAHLRPKCLIKQMPAELNTTLNWENIKRLATCLAWLRSGITCTSV